MKLVVDANVVISAAIVDGKTREVLRLGTATFLAPPELEDEVRSYVPLIAEKSGFREQDAEELLDSLFEGIGTVPYGIPASAMKKARDAIGGEDIDDVPYLATAIAVDATGFGRMIVCSITNSMLRVIRPGLYVQHMIIMMFSSRFVLRDTFQVRASISSRITSQ